MALATETFSDWLSQAQVPETRLTPEQRGLLQAAFCFRQCQGCDYYSTRLLSHFLLHCSSGLKVAQVARLLRISRPTASRQQGLSSKEAIQQAHHRLDGRPYGKLLPRFAGPIAGFLLAHPEATRADLLDFISRTFGVRVSRIAVYKFLKQYGLDHLNVPAPAQPPQAAPAPGSPPSASRFASASAQPPPSADATPAIPLPGPSLIPAPAPAPPFSSGGRSMPAPSC
jgi:transposase